ncbi:MAG: hypothetical protein EOO17_01995 [Chloroflexi bacterium]|nr:MAG: hypothetical protein EOO17_01995 [Chloroflexota bacterium]
MNRKEVISKILQASQGQSTNLAGSGAGWMGQVSGVQQQINQMLSEWTESKDDAVLHDSIAMLQTMSVLSEIEATELHDALAAINS